MLVYGQLDKSTPIAITFLDLAKAFDTINHQILLDTLYNYGIRGSAYNLIKSYLGNRIQKVKLNNIISQFQSVNMGVLIWLALNKLPLNTEKIVYIEFRNQVDSTPKNLDINIQGTKINRVESTKYLGIIFDSNMR